MSGRYKGKRITIMGLGTRGGGLGVARFLAAEGALLTVTDRRSEEDLASSIRDLHGLPIRFVLGRHDERDFTREGADIVIRNPGVRRNSPLLRLAREHGVAIEMEMSLFFRACLAPIIGITGTKGKTTTSTICASILQSWDPRTVLAGNMGISALEQLPRIAPDTPVIIELSSWQLEALDEHRLAPHIGVLTNISEDHLDVYDGFADYAATKRTITRNQTRDDVLIVNRTDEEAWKASKETTARVVPFADTRRDELGMWVDNRRLVWRTDNGSTEIPIPENPALTGSRQAANAAAAAAAALIQGASVDAVGRGLRGFSGIQNRFERVAVTAGVEYINDTSATAPVAAIAALERLPGRRIHLLAGGAGKQTDLSTFADAVQASVHGVYLLNGTATPDLESLLAARQVPLRGPYDSMARAVDAASHAATSGDVVLLSPGCASFGLFRDEFDRGDKFREAVRLVADRLNLTAQEASRS
ncbi:MAG: UDP-N-acetylmuramoyl-L-alanine--D-glutamate ligase [Thermomicrobiales bacterium]